MVDIPDNAWTGHAGSQLSGLYLAQGRRRLLRHDLLARSARPRPPCWVGGGSSCSILLGLLTRERGLRPGSRAAVPPSFPNDARAAAAATYQRVRSVGRFETCVLKTRTPS